MRSKAIQSHLSLLIWRVLYPVGFRGRSVRRAFSRIYERKAWRVRESVSGPGSDLEPTVAIRTELARLIGTLNVASMLDAGCGDFHWMKEMDLSKICYTGVDIVEELIALNQLRYSGDRRTFLALDISTGRLPAVDLILTRDCLVHLPLRHAMAALTNFKRSGSKYLLATTFPDTAENTDAPMGHWRPLNLLLPPFHLPEPVMLINEQRADESGQYIDKSLGLWRLDGVELKQRSARIPG